MLVYKKILLVRPFPVFVNYKSNANLRCFNNLCLTTKFSTNFCTSENPHAELIKQFTILINKKDDESLTNAAEMLA